MAAARRAPRIVTTVSSLTLPTTVFVHGLESSKETWQSVVAHCLRHALPAVAVDLRGHGESELGECN